MIGEMVLVVSGHFLPGGVTIIVTVVDHQTSFAGVLVPPYLAEEFRALPGEHWPVDDFN